MAEQKSVKYLLVGGGLASVNAAVGIRKVDSSGSILIVGLEDRFPYDRPPLTKGFLAGKVDDPEDIEAKDRSFYEQSDVRLEIGVAVESIDRGAKEAKLSSGASVTYENLLLATGATPKSLDLPGADLNGVFLLRTLGDSQAIKERSKNARSAVMIGAGYIGMEGAASLRSRGLEVTVIAPDKHPWAKFASETTGGFLKSAFMNKGVRFLLPDEPAEFLGDGSVSGVRTKSGKEIEADLVVVGVGVTLNLDLAKNAGLEVDEKHGVVVDETLRTSDPNIWAAGDIAAFPDVATTGERWHAEHYLNAKWQGERVGRNMAGQVEPYDRVAYFFSDMFDLHMALRGFPVGSKSARIIGDVEAGEYTELYTGSDGKVQMGLTFSHDEGKLDPVADRLEEIVRARPEPEGVSL